MIPLVTGLMPVQAEPNIKIRVEFILGQSFKDALGSQVAQETKDYVEGVLVNTLNEKIRYFHFLPSSSTEPHTLTFRFDRPAAGGDQGISRAMSYDDYIFLELKKDDSIIGPKHRWLFRDASASISNIDTKETIAARLSRDIEEREFNFIVENQLNEVSFTDDAEFVPNIPGWIINHSRRSMCMSQDSELKIESVVPVAEYVNNYVARVRRRVSNADNVSTFALPSGDDDVRPLKVDPENARVIAIYVEKYNPECESTFNESTPASTSFDQGGE